MTDSSEEQQQITNWFNTTYAKKGERYLRKVEAYEIFLSLVDLKPTDALLDVACGLGRLLQAAQASNCKMTGVDISPIAVAKTKALLPQANILEANAENLPFETGVFDVITCLGSLERMIDLGAVLDELHRVGSKDARYCILVRNSETVVWKWFKEALGLRNKAGHQGAKSLREWTHIFHQHGFNVGDVLPDQYPLQRKKRWLSLGIAHVDPKQVLDSGQAIERTGKFIFLLSKAKV
ncbi:class I SAM-dependent methyltransferase [Agaribacter flavus]|uniref:Class I SAM-dependent methyltransferase n=1 Tax=Agaribacter flavus TaxID=1902781 RepID=A0ABV7FMB7_9ALTE